MTPPCVVPTFRPYTVENLEFGGFYASSCESRVNAVGRVGDHQVRRDATEHARNVGCHCAVAAEQAMAAEHP